MQRTVFQGAQKLTNTLWDSLPQSVALICTYTKPDIKSGNTARQKHHSRHKGASR